MRAIVWLRLRYDYTQNGTQKTSLGNANEEYVEDKSQETKVGLPFLANR